MSTVSDEMILAAVRAFIRIPGLFPAMKGALEAAEAVRAKNKAAWSAAIREANEIAMAQWPCNAPTFPQGFIPWHGGGCPVAEGTVVDMLFRDGIIHDWRAIGRHATWWSHMNDATDVVAYRIHKPADFRLEAGKFYVTASGERVGPMKPYKVFHGFYADNSAGWWYEHGKGGVPENGPVPEILALSSDQESGHD
jgi:hypothetical protein